MSPPGHLAPSFPRAMVQNCCHSDLPGPHWSETVKCPPEHDEMLSFPTTYPGTGGGYHERTVM